MFARTQLVSAEKFLPGAVQVLVLVLARGRKK